MIPSQDLVVFSAAAGLGSGATWIAVRVALALGIVSDPNPIVPQHTRSVAYLGGVAVAAAALSSLGLLHVLSPLAPRAPLAAVVPAMLFLLLGLLDDVRVLAPFRKLALQSLIGAIAVASGAGAEFTGLRLLDGAIAWFWIVTIVNAFNLVDVSDGLLTGLAVIMLAFFSHVDPVPGNPALALVFCGASAGFLLFNLPPASIFLGDAGSHLLGYVLAFLTLEYVDTNGTWPAAPAMVLVAAVPLFEVFLLVTERRKKGLPWWRGSRDHFALRLQAAGYKRWHVNGIAWAFAAAMCAGAVKFVTTTAIGQFAILLATLVSFVLCWAALVRWSGEESGHPDVQVHRDAVVDGRGGR